MRESTGRSLLTSGDLNWVADLDEFEALCCKRMVDPFGSILSWLVSSVAQMVDSTLLFMVWESPSVAMGSFRGGRNGAANFLNWWCCEVSVARFGAGGR